MRKQFLLLILAVLSVLATAQNPVAQKYGQLVSADDLKDYLTILASDAMEGRATGTRGQKMAAAFIAAHFEELGLKGPVEGSYYQHFPLYSMKTPEIAVSASGIALKNGEEYTYFGTGDTQGDLNLPLVYVGRAREVDLSQVDIKNKAVAVSLNPNESLRNNPVITLLREKEARLVIAIMNSEDEYKSLSGMIQRFGGGRMSLSKEIASANLGTLIVPPAVATKMLKTTSEKLNKAVESKTLGKIKPVQLGISITPQVQEIKSENVLGYLEGTDKKDELVVVTAHYDHIGKRSRGEGDLINNGADDDGSGTVAVMSLAKAFAQAKKEGKGPRRSMLFMTVAAEEVGLLGSQYYTDKDPVFPLANTVVNLNLDMIGRTDPGHKDSAPYVYVIGSDKLSSDLHSLSEDMNKTYTKLNFDYTYNDQNHPERLYYRSDHWNFAKNNIPIIFYTDGIHEDYHKPSDEVDKIEFDLLTKRAQCVFYTAWEIANRDQRLVVDKK